VTQTFLVWFDSFFAGELVEIEPVKVAKLGLRLYLTLLDFPFLLSVMSGLD
jgi:hypothetical protein